MRKLLSVVLLMASVVLLGMAMGCGSSGNSSTPSPNYELAADANTVGLWHFNEGSGQDVGDSSGNAWNLVFGSNSSVETVDPAWAAAGRYGNGIAFTAADEDYVSGPGTAAGTFSGNEITVEFWIKTTSGNTSHPVVTGNVFFTAQLNDTGLIQFDVGDDNTWSGSLSAATAINDGNWHYVALVYDGPSGNMYVYIDGVLDGTKNLVTTVLSAPGTFFIGGRPSNTFVDGSMDEVRVSNIARSASEIAANYH